MKRSIRNTLLGGLASLLTGSPAFALGVTGGDVPLPAKTVAGKLTVSWNGTYADLLAADALATCWSTQRERSSGGGTTDSDWLIKDLSTKITAASCKTTCSNPAITAPADILYCAWVDSRKDPTCNVDAATNEQKALDLSKMRADTSTLPYVFPSVANLALSGTAAQAVRDRARDELAYAELNLCMAEHMRRQLDTVQIAFASTTDLEILQERVRERALAATYQFSIISKALASQTSPPLAINNVDYPIAALNQWGRIAFTSTTNWRVIGDDFAEAIRLLIEATDTAIELKVRQPAAQRSFGEYDWNNGGGTNVGVKGPRAQVLMDVAYDGYTTFTPVRRAVLTDMSAPQVSSLIGLAREANAIKLTLSNNTINRTTNATNLLVAVENYVRNQECARRSISPCPQATSGTSATDFKVTKAYGIDLSHALTVVDAFAQALLGPASFATAQTDVWGYDSHPFFTSTSGPFGPAQQLAFHVLGSHNFSGTASSATPATGDITIDRNFRVVPLLAHDIQAMRGPVRLPVKDFNPLGNAEPQYPYFRRAITAGPAYKRPVGSSTVLALARESLMQLAVLPSTRAPYNIFSRAQFAVPMIEKYIGPRQAIVRQQLASTANAAACTNCVSHSASFSTDASGNPVHNMSVDVITNSGDTFTSMAIAPGFAHAATAVQVQTSPYKSIWGTTQANVTGATYTTMAQTTVPNSTAVTNYVMRSATGSYASTSAHGMTVLIRSGTTYDHVFTGSPGTAGALTNGTPGTSIVFGGSLANKVQSVWRFDANRWSSPKFDAFGLPRNWTPAADASLQGEAPGVSVESHFLSRAATAASEATSALQQAFETLQQETADDTALQLADARSQQLSTIELQSLCGPATTTCKAGSTRRTPTIPDCTGSGEVRTFCDTVRADLQRMATSVPIANPVNTMLNSSVTAPRFLEFKGGRLQGLFLNQWNAWQTLADTLKSAIGVANAASAQVVAAEAEITAAQAEYDNVEADVATAWAQLIAQNASLAAQRTEYNTRKTTYEQQLAAAQREVDAECSTNAFTNARKAGWSFSGEDLTVDASVDASSWKYHVEDRDSRSWSPASMIAQQDRCQSAQRAFETAQQTLPQQTDGMQALIDSIQPQLDAINSAIDNLPKRTAAARARKQVAIERKAAAIQERDSQVLGSNQQLQTVFGQLLSTVAAIDEAFLQAETANARIALEQQQTGYDVRTRFGVRKRFHSYDLWRARALSENARRMAVAARRAIEGRYVVDMSKLTAPEPFVDAPSLWADDVYGSDLKPPIAVGLERSPTTASGIYTNKLGDYVNNLKLFLDGFTVERPSAQVKSDAEVVQLPGPSEQVLGSSYDAQFTYIAPGSAGWTFYCPNNSSWISHPQLTSFTEATPNWTLANACGGQPPTMARLSFRLDPWGRLNGSPTNAPFSSRYNVRSGDLVVNLVGTGIKDCERAYDPSSCYAEPFLRYDLQHVGPAWVTNFEQEWRSQEIPIAVVESGKALAAEEWLDPVSNGFGRPDVANVARMELHGRPVGGAYELVIHLDPTVRIERIERVQVLLQTEYWVRQQ